MEHGSRISQGTLNVRYERVRAAEHPPRGPFCVLECRHGLAEFSELGAIGHVERPCVRLGFFDLTCNEWVRAYMLSPTRRPSRLGGSLGAPAGPPTGRARPDASIGLSGIPSDSRESASVADGGLSEASPCDQAPAGALGSRLDRLRVQRTPKRIGRPSGIPSDSRESAMTLEIRASLKRCFEEQLDWTLDDIPRYYIEKLDWLPRLPGDKVFWK